MSVLEGIKEYIAKVKSILIITHEDPDGDAIGSSLALMHALRKLGKIVTVLIPKINPMYNILPGFSDIRTEIEDEEIELCIALDSSDLERLGSCRKYFENAEYTLVIDHHITNQNFGDVNYINAVASSTCQNLMVIFDELGIELDKNIAECIYTGILTDTGAFRYNVQAETFEFMAMLIETGIDTANIYRRMFDVITEKRVRLLGRALNTLEMYENGKIAITHVTKNDLEELESEDGDQENIVNFGRNIENAEVSVFIREKDGKQKVSLRSNEYVDVALIASKYLGGGHKKAAGFTADMPLEQLKNLLISEIQKQLK
jgi:phosphoesterase RecJ-like protein